MNETMTLETIAKDIRQFIFENYLFGYEESEFSNDMSFLDYGILDSLGIFELLTYIEKQFDITVSNDDILPDNLDSVNCVSRFILHKRAALARG